jgi:hypothetical protein
MEFANWQWEIPEMHAVTDVLDPFVSVLKFALPLHVFLGEAGQRQTCDEWKF